MKLSGIVRNSTKNNWLNVGVHVTWSAYPLTKQWFYHGILSHHTNNINKSQCFPHQQHFLFLFFPPVFPRSVSQAAELAPALQAEMEVKEAIQGAIHGDNGEVVQIVSSVATWDPIWYIADLNSAM